MKKGQVCRGKGIDALKSCTADLEHNDWHDASHVPSGEHEFREEFDCEPYHVDVPNTPSNERLIQLAAANPPPQHWLDGDEEDLFFDEDK